MVSRRNYDEIIDPQKTQRQVYVHGIYFRSKFRIYTKIFLVQQHSFIMSFLPI